MIDILHDLINNIIPINGLEFNYENNECVVYYQNNATPNAEQLSAINNLIAAWPLQCKKTSKIEELDIVWQHNINAGWTTTYGWKLGLSNNDVTLLTGVFILAKEAASMNIPNPINIVDTEGMTHSLTLQEFTILMLQYGQYRSMLSSQYAAIKNAIQACQTISDVDNIEIPQDLSVTGS